MNKERLNEIRNSLSNIWEFNIKGKEENVRWEINCIRKVLRAEELEGEKQPDVFPKPSKEETFQKAEGGAWVPYSKKDDEWLKEKIPLRDTNTYIEDGKAVKPESVNASDRLKLNVHFTKNVKLRAEIQPKGMRPYEVTLGGEQWEAGKGREYFRELKEIADLRIQGLIEEWEKAFETSWHGVAVKPKEKEEPNLIKVDDLNDFADRVEVLTQIDFYKRLKGKLERIQAGTLDIKDYTDHITDKRLELIKSIGK